MGSLLALVGICSLLEWKIPLVVFLTAFLFVYQALIGNTFWPYVSSVIITESGFSIASFSIWSGILFMALCTQTLMDGLTTAGTFFFFSGISLIGGVIYCFVLKEIKGVPAERLQLLYLPKSMQDEISDAHD